MWKDIGDGLKNHYKKRYFTPERYITDNPMEALTVLPSTPDFFGTKVCIVWIVAQPIGWYNPGGGGWVNNWPPAGWQEALDRHKEAYEKFTQYDLFIWVDRYFETLINAANDHSLITNMMSDTQDEIEDMCLHEMKDYGFHYMGPITSAVEENYFHDTIDEFFGIRS